VSGVSSVTKMTLFAAEKQRGVLGKAHAPGTSWGEMRFAWRKVMKGTWVRGGKILREKRLRWTGGRREWGNRVSPPRDWHSGWGASGGEERSEKERLT